MEWLDPLPLLGPATDLVNRDHPLNRGRVAWLMALPPLDGGRQLFDLLGLYKGTLTNGPVWSRGTYGGISTPLTYDGSNDYVDIPAPDAPFIGGLSIFAWVNFRVGSVYHQIAQKTTSNGGQNNPFDFRTDSGASNPLAFVRADALGNAAIFSGPNTGVGAWFRVGVTVQSGNMSDPVTFYVNGAPTVVSSSGSGTVAGNGQSIWLGRRQDGAVQLDGQMDDVSFWSRQISAAEALQDYELSRRGYPGVLRRQVPRPLVAAATTAYTLTAASGTFTQTGIAATLRAGRVVPAAAGSFALTGVAAGLKRGYPLVAAVGAFSETGVAAVLRVGRVLTSAKGAFTLTGIAANLQYGSGYRLTATVGAFSLTGVAANLRAVHTLPAAKGTFGETGVAAALKVGRGFPAVSGAFTLAGQSATLVYVSHLAIGASAGSFLISGQDATLRAPFRWSPVATTAETWTPQATTTEAWSSVPTIAESWSVI